MHKRVLVCFWISHFCISVQINSLQYKLKPLNYSNSEESSFHQ